MHWNNGKNKKYMWIYLEMTMYYLIKYIASDREDSIIGKPLALQAVMQANFGPIPGTAFRREQKRDSLHN